MTATPAPADPAARFREGSVSAGGTRVRYLEAGSGEPLVTIHGRGGLHPTAGHALLAGRFRVIALEVPGFGAQDSGLEGGAEDVAATLAAAAGALLGGGDHALLGTSMGGLLALWWATRLPDHVSTLCLEAPAAFRAGSPDPATLSPAELFAAMHAHPERKLLGPPDTAWLGRTQALFDRIMGEPHDGELARRVATLQVPTLALFGDRDRLIPTSGGRVLKSLLPRCTFAIVHDAAHDISGDRPEAFADAVTDFVERQEAWAVSHDSAVINR